MSVVLVEFFISTMDETILIYTDSQDYFLGPKN